MSPLYIYQALLTFAKSLIGIFVPVYLYSIGYSLVEVILYSIGTSIIYLIMIPISVKTINKLGFKYTLLFTTPIYLVHVIFLNFLSLSTLYYHLSWISFGLYMSFFWPTFHSEIAVNGSNKHRSSQMGTLQIITTLVGTSAPIISGYILEFTSFWYLLILTFSIVLLGLVPLLKSKDIRIKNYDFSYKDYYKLIKNKKNKISKKAFIYEGLDAILILRIWPILVFILLSKSFFNVGILLTTISFFSMIILYYTKSYFDKKGIDKELPNIMRFESVSWFFKSLVIFFGLFALYIIEGLGKLVRSHVNMLFMSIFYNNASKGDYMEYIILREWYLHTAKIMFAIGIMGIFILFGETIYTLSAIAFSGIFITKGMGSFREEN
ncbi:MAG: hypothetical protein PF569_07425 [Candidatus Woesearchaeota archaeon]|nr:hypothetical protein [Candidatus Woesearchaeota archaeon]